MSGTAGAPRETTVEELVPLLASRRLTLAVAESLTGGLLVAEFVRVPGASSVVLGGVVVYATQLKRDIVGVDAALLDAHGPVHPEVARQLADRVRARLAIEGRPARIGLSTTGVAGPDSQGGAAPGTVFVGIAIDDRVDVEPLALSGDRDAIRRATVRAAVSALARRLRHG